MPTFTGVSDDDIEDYRRATQKKPRVCPKCHRDTKAPLFDGCMTVNCPYGFELCI